MKTWILIGAAVLVVVVGSLLIVKKVSPVSWGWWGTYNTSSGLALKGYDPVSYFDGSGPTQGSEQLTHDWGGATWQFSSAESKNLFSSSPESYAARFGGFCAFAVSIGFTAEISPDAWHTEDGRLYVFADKNVRDDWVENLVEGSLEISTANWAKR